MEVACAQSGRTIVSPVVERIADAGRFLALRDEWNELLASSRADCVFLTHEWLATWWTHLGRGRRLAVLTVRDRSGRLIAALPLARTPRQASRFLPVPTLEFLASGVIGSDYLDLIVREDADGEATAAVAAWVRLDGRILRLSQLRLGESHAAGLASALAADGWQVVEQATDVCPFIDLSNLTWEAYLASLGASQRYNFRRRWKHLTESLGARFELAATPVQASVALDHLIRLHRQRWTARGGRSEAFADEPTLRFHRAFAELALARGWLRLFTLTAEGKPVASLYALSYQRRVYFYQSGFDPAYSRHSVGLVAMGLAIRHAIEEGATEYDFLHGREAYKLQWTRRTREIGRLELYPPDVLGAVCRRATALNRRARRLARLVLDRVAVV